MTQKRCTVHQRAAAIAAQGAKNAQADALKQKVSAKKKADVEAKRAKVQH